MDKKNKDSVYWVFFFFMGVSIFLLIEGKTLRGETFDEVPLFSIGATPIPEIKLEVTGGTNQIGRRTMVVSDSINFGSVSFIHAGTTVANGDSYLENGHLFLEAVVDLSVISSGTSSVVLELSKLKLSTNPFHRTYHSLSIDRAQKLDETQTDPSKSLLKTLTDSETVSLRLAFEITPGQTGNISDRFRLEANSR